MNKAVITITQIEYAVALEQKGSFQAAAKFCHVTQPTLSMQIQKLEEQLDLKLFDRSRKPVEPTSGGKRLLEQFRVIVREVAKVDSIRQQLAGSIQGGYQLGVIPTIAPYIVPQFLPLFRKSFPQVELTIREITTTEIVAGIRAGTLDGGLLSIPLAEPSLREVHLYDEPFCIYHSRKVSLPSDGDGRVALKSLPLDLLIMLGEGHCLRTQVLDFCAHGRDFSTVGFVFEAGSVATLVKTVDQTETFTILPLLAALELPTKKQEAQIKRFAKQNPFREIGLVTHRADVKRAIDDAICATVKQVVPESVMVDEFKGERLKMLPT